MASKLWLTSSSSDAGPTWSTTRVPLAERGEPGLSGAAIGCCIGVLLYFITTHFVAKWAAQNVRLIVEGPYLRLVSGGIFVSDRRMHFRTISDYTTHAGPLLRRFGMKTLSFTAAGSRNSLPTRIAGLVDPDKVRDALCEIDAAREN